MERLLNKNKNGEGRRRSHFHRLALDDEDDRKFLEICSYYGLGKIDMMNILIRKEYDILEKERTKKRH